MTRLALILTAALALAACGKQGDLTRPEPLFGHPPVSPKSTPAPKGPAVDTPDPTLDQGQSAR